jgi:hypothetical protein
MRQYIHDHPPEIYFISLALSVGIKVIMMAVIVIVNVFVITSAVSLLMSSYDYRD